MPPRRGYSPPVDPFPPLRRSGESSSSTPSYASIAARTSHPRHREDDGEGERANPSSGTGANEQHRWVAEDVDRRDVLDELNAYAEPIDVDPSPPWRLRRRPSGGQTLVDSEDNRAEAHPTESEAAGPSTRLIGTPSGTNASRTDAVAGGARNPSQRTQGSGVLTPTGSGSGSNRPAERSPPSPSPTRPARAESRSASRLGPIFTLEEMLSNIRQEARSDEQQQQATGSRLVRPSPSGQTVRAILEERRGQRAAPYSWGMERALPSGADRASAMLDAAAMALDGLGDPLVVPFSSGEDQDPAASGSRTIHRIASRPLDGSSNNNNVQASTSFLRRRRRNPAPVPASHFAWDPDESWHVGETGLTDDESNDGEAGADGYTVFNFMDRDREFDVDGPGPIRSTGALHRGGNNRRRRSFLERIDAPEDLRFPEPEEGITFPPPIRGVADATGCEPTNRELAESFAPLFVTSAGVRKSREIEEEEKKNIVDTTSDMRKRRRTGSSSSSDSGSSRPSYLKNTTLPVDSQLPSAFVAPLRRSHLALSTHTSPKYGSRPCITFAGCNPTGRDEDATALLTTTSVPLAAGVYYYEAEVMDKGVEGFMSVGWMKKGTNLRRLVGWDKGSWGWHGDDGRSFEGQGRGEPFSETWSTGDTVGCGVDFTTGRAFFTKNGRMMGHRFSKMAAGLHPAIGLRSVGETIVVNFNGPFMFDIDGYVRSIRDTFWREASRQQPVSEVPRLVDQVAALDQAEESGPWKGQHIEGDGEERKTDLAAPTKANKPFLQGAVETTTAAFALDYLAHHGHHSTYSLLRKAMANRSWISPCSKSVPVSDVSLKPTNEVGLSDFSSKHDALRYLHDAMLRPIDRPYPIKLLADFTPPLCEANIHALYDVGYQSQICRFLRILHVSTRSSDDDEDAIFEKVLEEGRALREGNNRSQPFPSPELAKVGEEALGLLGTPQLVDSEVWNKRRKQWASYTVNTLRELNGMKSLSHLEQAVKQTGIVLRTLAEKDGKSGATFLDVKRIVE
ncbi:hypothetical protein I316_07521 [Kwoniella heveanensis BCC8398]|uniref:B30.2/SPRY domain-containing protein n=1 Tax=Kwoniella heveanensis BCC8398 TaxID=1296120 RepID=A0A1B9GIJ4_9TREE|nr:hypothetical protein I316_07521 [Kwoniella heveanensis BCC8398]